MSTCYMVRIQTSVISATNLNKILDDFGVEVKNVDNGKSGDLVVDGIAYANSQGRRLFHNGLAEAIQEVAPSARISTSWVEADAQAPSGPYYETPPKHNVRVIAVVDGGVLRDVYATKGISIDLEVLDIDCLRNGGWIEEDFEEQTQRLQKLSDEVDDIANGSNTTMVSVPM